MNDSELKQLVQDELSSETDIDLANVAVSVENHVVTLFGKQSSIAALSSCESAVKRVGGVKAVVMEMDVAIDHDGPDDKTLALTIIELLTMNPSIPEKQIQLVVESGVVTLTGSVEQHHERLLAKSYVESLKGVVKVIDNIQVSQSVSDVTICKTLQDALKRRAAINESNIVVTSSHGVVYVSGSVRNIFEQESVIKTAWSVPGVQQVIDRLELANTVKKI